METAIGYVPKAEDIDIEELNISRDTIRNLLSVDKEHWLEDIDNIKAFYDKLGKSVPAELREELAKLEENLKK